MTSSKTPVRAALDDDSPLCAKVRDGIGAVQNSHRKYISEELRNEFADSIDVDEALRPGREGENRWDYLLGHGATGHVIGLEPHSAKHDEISTVIRKKEAAQKQMETHLKPGAHIKMWYWVASRKIQIPQLDKARLRLSQHGICFVGTMLRRVDLPASTFAQPKKAGKKR